MSAFGIPTTVLKIALTVLAATNASAIMDTPWTLTYTHAMVGLHHGSISISAGVADIDECENGTNSCDVNAQCNNTEGGYNCSCLIGYTGDGFNCTSMHTYRAVLSYVCIYVLPDIDECEDNPCDDDALCTDTDGSFYCNCKEGYTGNGTYCRGV